MLNEGNQIQNFILCVCENLWYHFITVLELISYGLDFLTSYCSSSGSTRQKVMVPTVSVCSTTLVWKKFRAFFSAVKGLERNSGRFSLQNRIQSVFLCLGMVGNEIPSVFCSAKQTEFRQKIHNFRLFRCTAEYFFSEIDDPRYLFYIKNNPTSFILNIILPIFI
jgi:hypothetical protein